MTSRRLVLIVLALVITATACSNADTGTEATASASTSPSVESPAAPSPSTDEPTSPDAESPSPSPEPVGTRKTTFIANNVTLWNSEESDLGFRVLFDSPDASVSVRLRGVPANNQVVSVCPVRGLTKTSPGDTCSYPSNTELIEIRHGSRFNGVEVLLLGTSPNGGERHTLGQIRVIYNGPETGGETTVKTPPILRPRSGKPCRNNACNPTFELIPTNTGRLRATTDFDGSGLAELAIEAGGKTIDSAEGRPNLRVAGRVPTDGNPLIALRNAGSRTLGVAITNITLP